MGWKDDYANLVKRADVVVICGQGLVQRVYAKNSRAVPFIIDLDDKDIADARDKLAAMDDLAADHDFTQIW